MSNLDYAKNQLDSLPENALEKVIAFIAVQKVSLGMFEDDTEYLSSIPRMMEIIKQGMETPLSECVPLSEVWSDV